MITYQDIEVQIDDIFEHITFETFYGNSIAQNKIDKLKESIREMQKDCLCTMDESTGNESHSCCNNCGGIQR